DAHAPTFREPPLRGLGRSTLADPVRIVVRTDEHHACLRRQHERTNPAGREPGPCRYSACRRNRQRRLNAVGNTQPRVRPYLAELDTAAPNWPKGSAIAPTIIWRQVGSMDSYDATLNMLNERNHGWQVSSNISVPALGCPAQGSRRRNGDASAREIAPHEALQRVEGALPDGARPRDLALVVVVVGQCLCDGVPGLDLAVEQPTPAKLGEHIVTVAAAEAPDEHPASVSLAQSETPPAVQWASAAPAAALTTRVAERMGDVGGVHRVAPRGVATLLSRVRRRRSAGDTSPSDVEHRGALRRPFAHRSASPQR